MPAQDPSVPSEKGFFLLLFLVNLLSITGIMMVMPMAPALVNSLNMAPEQIGYLAGGATLLSAIVALLVAPWLDKVARVPLMAMCLVVRSLLLCACGFATNLEWLFGLYILAACFSGPIGGLLMAAVVDITPIQQRGKAMGAMAAALSLAAVVTVPLALAISEFYHWRYAFFLFGGIGMALALLLPAFAPVSLLAPTQVASHDNRKTAFSRLMLLALATVSVQMFGHFLWVPHFASLFQFNFGFSGTLLPALFAVAGVISLMMLILCGKWADQGKGKPILISASLILVLTLVSWILPLGQSQLSMALIFVLFSLYMAASSVRSSTTMMLTSEIPAPSQRAGFMAAQDSVSNLAMGLAAMCGAMLISSNQQSTLVGIEWLSFGAIICVIAALGFVWRLFSNESSGEVNNVQLDAAPVLEQ